MASKTIQAAGGIVVRHGARPLVAVVQRSKDDAWVLPRGKLKRDENPVRGARREVVEETGHRVRVHEFLGAITYRAGGRPKVVQFWRMQAEAKPSHEVMADIVAVEWLPLKAAVRRLSYPLEKLFLRNIGSRAIPRRKRRVGRKAAPSARKQASKKTGKRSLKKTAKKTDKTRKRKPPPRARKTASHTAKTKPHVRKPAAARKHARRQAAVKHGAHRPAAPKRATDKRAAHKRAMPVSVAPAAFERALGTAASTPAAERKTILQRVLGRLAG